MRLDMLAPDACFEFVKLIPDSQITYDKQIGRGGFGMVYSGTFRTEQGESIPVALKQLISTTGKAISTDEYREFQQEVYVMRYGAHNNPNNPIDQQSTTANLTLCPD
jgi:hypothetical protein